MLFFKITCFVWAAIGIVSRIAMAVMKDNWNQWEENKAYKEKRPFWVVLIAIFGLILIGAVWTVYLVYDVQYGWILASLISLTFLKIATLLFNYEKFRTFLKDTLADKKKMLSLNISVIILSIILIGMGVFLY